MVFRERAMSKKILVVEDHPDFRQIIAVLIRHMNYEVIEAENGEEGIRKALAKIPDLIIMDLGLPRMDGIEAAARLKQNPITARIPIIAYTSWKAEEYRDKALRAGAVEYLPKPASSQTFRKVVERVLQNGS